MSANVQALIDCLGDVAISVVRRRRRVAWLEERIALLDRARILVRRWVVTRKLIERYNRQLAVRRAELDTIQRRIRELEAA